MQASHLVDCIKKQGATFFTGVPDSQLKPLCDYLMKHEGISENHIVAPNEGISVALATGEYLAGGKLSCVYLQNSGLGNILNPVCSLAHQQVYQIPIIYVVGWRGEPGVKDEPQHVFQGAITLETLELMGIPYVILSKDMPDAQFDIEFEKQSEYLFQGRSIAIVVKKNALTSNDDASYHNSHTLNRERAIEQIVLACPDTALVVSSTGKISRELFEIRERNGQSHSSDFLTVGSMGHCSSIAYRLATKAKKQKVICLDGDGAVLMHMGALAAIGASAPSNMIHIVLDNQAHETVGGMPTLSKAIDLCAIAAGCGYRSCKCVDSEQELVEALHDALQMECLSMIVVKLALGSRPDLGRPTKTPLENRDAFMAKILR